MEIGSQRIVGLHDDRRQDVISENLAGRGETGYFAFDAGTVLGPPDVVMPKVSAPDRSPTASAFRVNAGVSGMNVGRMSTSSSTISELMDARPTSFMLIRSAGGTAFVPKFGKDLLRVRVEPERDDLTDVESEQLGDDRVQ